MSNLLVVDLKNVKKLYSVNDKYKNRKTQVSWYGLFCNKAHLYFCLNGFKAIYLCSNHDMDQNIN